MRRLSALVILLLSLVNVATAQPMMMGGANTPDATAGHEKMPDFGDTGTIEGSLFTVDASGKKSPVAGQEVSMQVLNNGQQVLMLKKTSDEKGMFIFKNIFKNTEFAYGFGTLYQEGLYVFPHLSLTEKETVKKIDFQIGENSPYKRDPTTMGMPPSEGGASGNTQGAPMGAMPQGAKHGHDTSWSAPYQEIAIGLCALIVIGVVLVYAKL